MPDESTRDGFATTEPGGTATPTQDTIVPTGHIDQRRLPDPRAIVLPAAGYVMGGLIGKGGMGEVIAAQDQRIGREVAIKRMRGAAPEPMAVARFLREARIQARLDHPAICPVYELGTDEQGRPFFTMKRLAGTTLMDRLEEKLPEGEPAKPIQPLLRAFADVCMAVGLAHERGIVHRDLKPANIMLGDYNEVYVLDWGVARVLAETGAASPIAADIVTLDGDLETKGMLGTPGYMAPEQIDGSDVTTGTDVYALGAILYEILAGESLHPRGRGSISHTLDTPQESPAARKPDRAIAPELDRVCFEALAKDPSERPSARSLGERVQNYLDGDRDLEHRKKLAAEQLASARAALDDASDDSRSTAMRRAVRALALDPESIEAGALVSKLMLEPPNVIPPALQKSLDEEDRESQGTRSRTAMAVYISVFAFLFAIPFMTIKSWTWLIALNATLAALAAFTYVAGRTGRVSVPAAMAGNLVLVVVFSRLAGPLIITPIVVCGVMLALSGNPWLLARKSILIAWGALACTAPLILEAAGVLGETWRLKEGVYMVRSSVFASPGNIDGAMLVAANTIFVITIGIYALATNRAAHDAKQRIHIQKWHLEQSIPTTLTTSMARP